MINAWLYTVVGFIVLMYPITIPVRLALRPTRMNLFIAIGLTPLMVATSTLGLLMFLLGTEVLKGTIAITL
jgi:hypothetical protein